MKLLLVVQLTQGFRGSIIAPILALFIRRQGLTVAQIGLLGTAGMLGWLIFEPIVGVIADRVRKKWLIIFAIVTSSFIFISYPSARRPWHFALLMFSRSSVMSAYAVSIKAMMAELLPTSGRGKTYGRYRSIISMGGIIGPFLGGYLTAEISPDIPFLISGGIGVISLTAVLLMRYDGRQFRETESHSEALEQVSLMTRPFLSILLIRGLVLFNHVFRGNVLPIFLHESPRFRASETQIGTYMGIVQLAGALSQMFLGDLIDRVGSKIFMTASMGLTGLSYISMIYFTGIPPLYLLGGFQGILSSSYDISMMLYLISIIPEGRTGMAMGIYSEAENIGGMIASPSIGIIYDSIGPIFSVLFVSTILIANAVLAILLIKKDA